MNSVNLIVLSAFIVYGVSAISCPRCTNENDWQTCTGTQTCGGGDDTCQLEIDNNNNDRYKLIYHCTHSQNCQHHETQHCDLTAQGRCIFCCDSLASCRTQLEGVFDAFP
ncbi:collagen alpha-1(XII) chain [Biomphalaria glabrata]|nr:collagen alpha-1(XII) chain-like [Biomphalaria glabrata]